MVMTNCFIWQKQGSLTTKFGKNTNCDKMMNISNIGSHLFFHIVCCFLLIIYVSSQSEFNSELKGKFLKFAVGGEV